MNSFIKNETDNKAAVYFYNYGEIDGKKLKYAVVVARFKEKWIFCRHKLRNTYEIPGGHIEEGENVTEAARRELFEETGAIEFNLLPVCIYSVVRDVEESFGGLFFAEVHKLAFIGDSFEIGEICLFETLPDSLTYPDIQPFLFNRVRAFTKNYANKLDFICPKE